MRHFLVDCTVDLGCPGHTRRKAFGITSKKRVPTDMDHTRSHFVLKFIQMVTVDVEIHGTLMIFSIFSILFSVNTIDPRPAGIGNGVSGRLICQILSHPRRLRVSILPD